VILCVGANGEWDSEGQDRPDLGLPGAQDELIARVSAANPRTVVVLQTGGPIAIPWLDDVGAVLQAWYPGQECGNAIADVLFGAAEPGGRLPQTFPARLEDNPAFLNYPGENGRVTYGEGLFIGYRYYDKKRITPLFPFGHGLSYTTFAFGEPRLSADSIGPGESLTVTIDVTNTGERAGSEIVQCYVADEHSALIRPPKELRAFAKLQLAPGEIQTATLVLDPRALAYYDDRQGLWVAEAGEFGVLIGRSADAIVARASFRLTETTTFPA
jgi:beta-glucosidase